MTESIADWAVYRFKIFETIFFPLLNSMICTVSRTCQLNGLLPFYSIVNFSNKNNVCVTCFISVFILVGFGLFFIRKENGTFPVLNFLISIWKKKVEWGGVSKKISLRSEKLTKFKSNYEKSKFCSTVMQRMNIKEEKTRKLNNQKEKKSKIGKATKGVKREFR